MQSKADEDGQSTALPSSEWSDPNRVEDYLAREIPHRTAAEQLLTLIHREYPRALGVGTDISQPMLQRARAALAQQDLLALHEHDLTEPLLNLVPLTRAAPLDAIVSALAIHHLEDERKRTLFAEVRALLRPGGIFANLDLTTSPTPAIHAQFRAAVGRRDDDPADRLAGTCDQLRWLREAGFAQTDCRFKWLELTLFVAVRD